MNLNGELVNVLGVVFDWDKYIARILASKARDFTKNALMEDIVIDVTGDIIMQAKDGTLAVAVKKAHDAAKTHEELLRNVQGVVMQATKYRASDAVRYKYRSRIPQYTQEEEEGFVARQDAEITLEQYKALLVNELELMAQAADWKRNTKLARRYRLAAQVVPDRVDGVHGLQAKHGIKSSSTMAAIVDDIGQALARIAARLDNPALLRGTAGVKVG